MLRRPLCLAALIWCALCVTAFFLRLPVLPGMTSADESRALERIFSSGRERLLTGRVASAKRTGSGVQVVLKKAFLSGETAAGYTDTEREKRKEDPGEDGLLIELDGVRFYLGEDRLIPAGTLLAVRGYPGRVPDAANPGQFRPCASARLEGIFYEIGRAEIVSESPGAPGFADRIREAALRAQERVRERICRQYPEDVSGILAAVLIGDRSGIAEEQKELWRDGGIFHILAISGLHLTMAGTALRWILDRAGMPVKWSGLTAVLALTVYTVVIGAPVSAVRALVMFVYLTGARIFFRSPDRWNAIALASLLILLGNPWYLFAPGFQLSFSAVILLTLCRRRGKLFTALALYLGMLPVQLWYFYRIPLFSPALNLILLPALPFLLAAGAAGAVFGSVTAFPAVFMVRGIEAILSALERTLTLGVAAGRPAVWQLILYGIAVAVLYGLYRLLRRKKRRLLLLALIPAAAGVFFLPRFTGVDLTFLDVGQGDGIVCRIREKGSPDSWDLLIDGGSVSAENVGEKRILPFLSFEGVRRIDDLFVTHADQDHVNGILQILHGIADGTRDLRVGRIALPKTAEKNDAYREIEELAGRMSVPVLYLSSGDVFRRGGATVRVLGPAPPKDGADPPGSSPDPRGSAADLTVSGPDTAGSPVGSDLNARSLVLLISYGSFDALLTGDVTGSGEEYLIRELRDRMKSGAADPGSRTGSGAGTRNASSVEVLKVAHHGSRYSTPEEFLDLVSPTCSVISCGARNSYGHPHGELLARLRTCGTRIFRTDQDGAVRFRSDGEGFRAASYCTERGFL